MTESRRFRCPRLATYSIDATSNPFPHLPCWMQPPRRRKGKRRILDIPSHKQQKAGLLSTNIKTVQNCLCFYPLSHAYKIPTTISTAARQPPHPSKASPYCSRSKNLSYSSCFSFLVFRVPIRFISWKNFAISRRSLGVFERYASRSRGSSRNPPPESSSSISLSRIFYPPSLFRPLQCRLEIHQGSDMTVAPAVTLVANVALLIQRQDRPHP